MLATPGRTPAGARNTTRHCGACLVSSGNGPVGAAATNRELSLRNRDGRMHGRGTSVACWPATVRVAAVGNRESPFRKHANIRHPPRSATGSSVREKLNNFCGYCDLPGREILSARRHAPVQLVGKKPRQNCWMSCYAPDGTVHAMAVVQELQPVAFANSSRRLRIRLLNCGDDAHCARAATAAEGDTVVLAKTADRSYLQTLVFDAIEG